MEAGISDLYWLQGGATIGVMKQKLKQVLSQRPKHYITDSRYVPSAVLIPLYQKEGQYFILFIQRTERVKDHKGQISFPGGAYEQKDGTLVNTAVREATEEVGLKAGDIEILGELDDMLTIGSGYIISPFVAVIPWPYQFEVDNWETEEVIEVPLSVLLDRDCIRQGTDEIDGQEINTYFYHCGDKVIWGATARILNQFLDIIVRII